MRNDDADNLRYDAGRKRIYVGYGGGALGEIDDGGDKVGETKLDAHPESFQLEKDGPRIYVNLPGSRKVAVLGREKRAVVATWSLGMALSNDPMTLNQAHHRSGTRARTGFFAPELDRLFLAVRRHGEQATAIRVFAPVQ